MDEKQYNVRTAEVQCQIQEVKVREAKSKLDHGYLKLKVDFDQGYNTLKSEFEIAQQELQRSQAWLEKVKADKELGFEKTS